MGAGRCGRWGTTERRGSSSTSTRCTENHPAPSLACHPGQRPSRLTASGNSEFPPAAMRAGLAAVILRWMRPRYLIVNDSPAFLSAAKNLLERQGLAVVGVAANVSECLRSVDQLAPDVILVDIDLGSDSGFEVARRLARRGIRADVIFISMHTADDYADLIAASGAAGFVSKSELSRKTIEQTLIEAPAAG